MAVPNNVISVINSLTFDHDLLEDGRHVITIAETITMFPSDFVDGVAETPVLFVSNSILVIRRGKYTVDLENLPDNLEFLRQDDNILYFVIKGDCDIPLIPVQNQETT